MVRRYTFGVGTHWLSLSCFLNIVTAWAIVHHFIFMEKSPGASRRELIAQYLVAFASLVVAGAGRYSIDALLPDK